MPCSFPEHHGGGSTRTGAGIASAADGIAQIIAWAAIAVVAINVAAFVFHVLVILFTCLGFLGLGYITGWLLVRRYRRQRRRSMALMPYQGRQPVAWQQAPPIAQPQQQLPQGGQHLHIHLSPDMDPDQVSRIIRGGGGQ